ncbi:MAG: 1-deoxy-D-xylulose-5-phosphate reductoisomerase, partial [Candidatus Omnitrophica bacterium]|nr:1-deoxy-D-xylulose-5-phosphate reductoisomerase [Candidatus Omnitrophota bacterium]
MSIKNISIVGSTGSIGMSTLRVVQAHPKSLSVVALAAKRNAEALYEQARKFRPKLVCIYEQDQAGWLEGRLKRFGIRVVTGDEGLIEVSTTRGAHQIVFATVGAVGLKPILAAIRAGKTVAIANKEPLVMAGELLIREAARNHVSIIPIDSEHSGLWQCLEGQTRGMVKKLILTSSGGPFFRKKIDFNKVTSRQALKHPRWKMGPKITIDSATLMNKGLEVIEAHYLYGIPYENIDVVVHPQSIVHSMVEFVDGSVMAQLSSADMRHPIQYCLTYPGRRPAT